MGLFSKIVNPGPTKGVSPQPQPHTCDFRSGHREGDFMVYPCLADAGCNAAKFVKVED